jgi:hypothetical protein
VRDAGLGRTNDVAGQAEFLAVADCGLARDASLPAYLAVAVPGAQKLFDLAPGFVRQLREVMGVFDMRSFRWIGLQRCTHTTQC